LERGIRGKNNRRSRRRGLKLTRIMLHPKRRRGAHLKREGNGKNRVRSGTVTVLP
jgi:hypothetical protein